MKSVHATFLLMLLFAAAAMAGAPPAAAQGVDLLLLPFDEIGAGAKQSWISRAIQQSMTAELSRLRWVQLLDATPASSSPATDAAQAIRIAKAAGAQLVIFGSYQIVQADLRVTGQVLDVQTGRAVGGLKATGAIRDLFALEDTLAEQAKRLLPQPAVAEVKAQDPAPAPGPKLAVEPNGPVRVGVYEGSDLERSLRYPDEYERWARQRYYYSAPDDYAYWGYGPYRSYPYGGQRGYYPYWRYGCGYFPGVSINVGTPAFDYSKARGNVAGYYPMTTGYYPLTTGYYPLTLQNPPPMTLQKPPSNVVTPVP